MPHTATAPHTAIVAPRATEPAPGRVGAAVAALEPVSLQEVLALAELQHRVDRKYLVPAALLPRVLAAATPAPRVLQIAGRRSFGYDTVYFDTPTLDSYRHHLQGRRRRAKVRTRTYTDTAESVLEVKVSGHRGATAKYRTSCSPSARSQLGPWGSLFVRTYAPELVAGGLQAVATTRYDRTTLLSADGLSRATIDAGLVAEWSGATVSLRPDLLIVETKTAGPAGPVDIALRTLGLRPRRLSKYCLAVAALLPGVANAPWRPVLQHAFGPTSPAAAGSSPTPGPGAPLLTDWSA